MTTFLTACAWVFGVLSIIRIVAVFLQGCNMMAATPFESRKNAIADAIIKTLVVPVMIAVVSILWLVYGG